MVSAGCCDVAGAAEFEDSDGQVAEGGHDLGAVAGSDLGGVFAVGGVADVVQRFDVPVAAYSGGEVGGAAWPAARLVMAWTVTSAISRGRRGAGSGG